MHPSWPPAALDGSLLFSSIALASLATDLTFLAYFIVAEALAVFSTGSAVALDLYSRSALLELARAQGREEHVTARLEHTGAYELSARLVRFLGSALLIVGIAFLALHDYLSGATNPPGSMPWTAVAAAIGVTFVVNFVLNDVVVRLFVQRRPSRFLLNALPYLEMLRWVTAPIRLPLVGLARLLFGARLEEPDTSAREDVLESVGEGEREGSLTADEADMIESIMDLDTATVEQICTPRGEVAMIQEGATVEEAVAFLLERGHRRGPIYGRDRDDVVGVVYAFDLLEQVAKGHVRRDVREIMRSPFFVPEGKPLNDLLNEMRGRRVSLAVVLNEFGGTSGVVTIEDLLEEIVGEIEDEHDREETPPSPGQDGVLVVEGRTSIEEVNRVLSVSLPQDEDFETVGGLVFHQMGKVPRVGDRLTVDNVQLTVMEADERTVKRLRLQVTTSGRWLRVARIAYETEAIVLRAIPFAETSQVVHLATPDRGLVTAIAKGARRPGPAFQGGLAVATIGEASLTSRPRAEMDLLRRFRRQDLLRGLADELARYYAASYALELLRAWMRPALPSPPLYRSARLALRAFASGARASLPSWVVWIEARAITAAGQQPLLTACAACGTVVTEERCFSPAAGGLVHARCAPPGPRRRISTQELSALRRLYEAPLELLAAEPLNASEVRAARRAHDLLVPHLLERRPRGLDTAPRPTPEERLE